MLRFAEVNALLAYGPDRDQGRHLLNPLSPSLLAAAVVNIVGMVGSQIVRYFPLCVLKTVNRPMTVPKEVIGSLGSVPE